VRGTHDGQQVGTSENPVFHERIKQIELRYHFIHDYIEKGLIDADYINT
jgi:hypothetical protein